MARPKAARTMTHADLTKAAYRFGGKESWNQRDFRASRLPLGATPIFFLTVLAGLTLWVINSTERPSQRETPTREIAYLLQGPLRDINGGIQPAINLPLSAGRQDVPAHRDARQSHHAIITDDARHASFLSPLIERPSALFIPQSNENSLKDISLSQGTHDRHINSQRAQSFTPAHALPNRQLFSFYPLNYLFEQLSNLAAPQILLLAPISILIILVGYNILRYNWRHFKNQNVSRIMQSTVQDALSAASCGLWDWDLKTDQIFWSSSIYEMLGRQPLKDNISLIELIQMIHPDDVDFLTILKPETCSPNIRLDHQFRARHINGEWRWLQLRAQFIKQPSDERLRLIGAIVDISDSREIIDLQRKSLEENEIKLREFEQFLNESKEELSHTRQSLEIQAQQLATLAERLHHQKNEVETAYLAKSQFLANMSHELRTPLNAIIGFSEMMQAEPFGTLGSPKYIEYCQNIYKGGVYLNQTLSDILDMSLLESGKMQLTKKRINLSDEIRKVSSLWLKKAEEKNIKFSIDIAKELECQVDITAITKTLNALLSNGIKFNKKAGYLRLTARRSCDKVTIYITDSGQGITPEALARLGNPFEQYSELLDNGMKGPGLGFAIARGLMNLHKGSLRIRSRAGSGTVVAVSLPCHSLSHDQLRDINFPRKAA